MAGVEAGTSDEAKLWRGLMALGIRLALAEW
jgi:hypothetical protein